MEQMTFQEFVALEKHVQESPDFEWLGEDVERVICKRCSTRATVAVIELRNVHVHEESHDEPKPNTHGTIPWWVES